MDSVKHSPTKNPDYQLLFSYGVFFLFVIAFLILVPTKTVSENIEVSSTENEIYSVQEPYETQEPYEVQESVLVKEAYPGTYTAQDITFAGGVISNYIPFEMMDKSEWHFVTKNTTVTRYRNVTKYLDVLKFRNVTKTRIEQQPAEVNWIFGFKTPYAFHLPFIR